MKTKTLLDFTAKTGRTETNFLWIFLHTTACCPDFFILQVILLPCTFYGFYAVFQFSQSEHLPQPSITAVWNESEPKRATLWKISLLLLRWILNSPPLSGLVCLLSDFCFLQISESPWHSETHLAVWCWFPVPVFSFRIS